MKTEMTAQVAADAPIIAIWRRGKLDSLLRHSNQGSQYTNKQFQRMIADSSDACWTSHCGSCWDSAAMESFLSSFETERIERKDYRLRDEARANVFDNIERFYHPTWRCSTIDHESPIDCEFVAGVT